MTSKVRAQQCWHASSSLFADDEFITDSFSCAERELQAVTRVYVHVYIRMYVPSTYSLQVVLLCHS